MKLLFQGHLFDTLKSVLPIFIVWFMKICYLNVLISIILKFSAELQFVGMNLFSLHNRKLFFKTTGGVAD